MSTRTAEGRSPHAAPGADPEASLRSDGRTAHHEENREIVARLVAKWRRFEFLSDADQKRLTIALQRMRMSCDDVYLLDEKKRSGRKADEVAALLADLLATEGLGQRRPVQVFDFVAEASIEQGMLGLLGFKMALFTGVLDGGDPEVLLGGSRLARFTDTVGAVAEQIPETPREAPADEEPLPEALAEPHPAGPAAADVAATSVTQAARSEPPAGLELAGLFRAGASLLGQLAAAADAAASGKPVDSGVRFEKDAATGMTMLRVEVPDSEALFGAFRALARVVGGEGHRDGGQVAGRS